MGPLTQPEKTESQAKNRKLMLEEVLDRGHAPLLAKAGIQMIIASPKRHEKLGRSEFVVKKIKFFLASALKSWAFSDEFDFYHKVSLMAQYMNERPIFHTPEGILTPYSLEQAMLKRSAAKPKVFTIAEFLIPTEKQIYNQILKMAEFSRQILYEVSAEAAFHLLNKRVLNQKFKIGELVYIPDRLIKKHPNSLRDALGKVKEVASTARDYVIELLDGDTVKRHYSDLVSASVTQNQSDIILIDPFQLVDYKTRIIPDHLYPKFRLLLDKFKDGTNIPQMDLSAQQDNTSTLQDTDEGNDYQTGNERVTKAMESNALHGTDATIRKIVQYTTPDNIEFPADLREIKKPRSYNKRKRDDMEKRTKTGYVEPIQVQGTNNSELYETPTQVQQTNTIHETEPENTEPQFEEIQTTTRRSKRIPKLSAKALEMLQYQEWHDKIDN